MKANKTYKDSVFTLYMDDPKRLVEVYNAFEGTHYPLDTAVKINTIRNALYKDRTNDMSFILNGELIILMEHQSTINENMPLRMLLYLSRLYEKYLMDEGKDGTVYRKKKVELPTPKFYVVYNGYEEYPEVSTIRLSDSFVKRESVFQMDVEVKVFNINAEMDPNIIVMSDSLRQYSLFIHQVNVELTKTKDLAQAISNAIDICKRKDIMKEFLTQHGSEVSNMLFDEWKLDEALKIEREEGIEIGDERGVNRERTRIIAAMHNKGMKAERIAESIDYPLHKVNLIIDKIKKEKS